jgi:hypothetical protein
MLCNNIDVEKEQLSFTIDTGYAVDELSDHALLYCTWP